MLENLNEETIKLLDLILRMKIMKPPMSGMLNGSGPKWITKIKQRYT